jgi:hypothetical protein
MDGDLCHGAVAVECTPGGAADFVQPNAPCRELMQDTIAEAAEPSRRRLGPMQDDLPVALFPCGDSHRPQGENVDVSERIARPAPQPHIRVAGAPLSFI